ncbi:MAG TPA: hypothetical protein VGL58_13170 [Caulobacteraceae bacterium]|jgi:hypothetical protein
MRKALIALAAAGAVAAVALPAFAQSYDADAAQHESNLRARISDGVQDGNLTFDQGSRLRSELRQIVDLDERYQSEGMSDWQARDLNSRLSLLDSRLNYDLGMTQDEDSSWQSY